MPAAATGQVEASVTSTLLTCWRNARLVVTESAGQPTSTQTARPGRDRVYVLTWSTLATWPPTVQTAARHFTPKTGIPSVLNGLNAEIVSGIPER